MLVASKEFLAHHNSCVWLLGTQPCVLQVPAYLKRNQQIVTLEKQQLEEYIKLREQPVSRILQLSLLASHASCNAMCTQS